MFDIIVFALALFLGMLGIAFVISGVRMFSTRNAEPRMKKVVVVNKDNQWEEIEIETEESIFDRIR